MHCGSDWVGAKKEALALAGEEVREDGMRKNLKEARRRAGLTQQQMADRLGISFVYYQKIEAGNRDGNFAIWDDLEDITGIHQRKLREISESRHGKAENP